MTRVFKIIPMIRQIKIIPIFKEKVHGAIWRLLVSQISRCYYFLTPPPLSKKIIIIGWHIVDEQLVTIDQRCRWTLDATELNCAGSDDDGGSA